MADSDNTTSLPLVTSRRASARTAIAATGSHPQTTDCIDIKRDQSTDPAVAAWREWLPKVMIQLPDNKIVTLHSLDAIRDVLGVGSVDVAVGAKAEADLAAHQARWDTSDRSIGYSATLRAESEAADRAEASLEALSETPAISLAGVAAKLDAILREGQPSKVDAEFPWPHIRSVLEDIDRISARIELK